MREIFTSSSSADPDQSDTLAFREESIGKRAVERDLERSVGDMSVSALHSCEYEDEAQPATLSLGCRNGNLCNARVVRIWRRFFFFSHYVCEK